MKSAIRKAVSLMVRNDRLWALVEATLIRAARAAEWERGRRDRDARRDRMEVAVTAICPDLRVRHGIFKGMTYAERAAAGSQLAPKLLGSYEAELRGITERICSTTSSTSGVRKAITPSVSRCGCRTRRSTPTMSMKRRSVCAGEWPMSTVCLHRSSPGPSATRARLMSIPFSGKALVISDCEGYEKQLFTAESVAFLAPHDVLVEVHDFVDIEISSYLRGVFAATHDVIQSIDDIKKAQDYSYPELEGLDLAMRREVLAERRPTAMEWFFMSSRAGAVA
jgi:hypothetical protein